MVTGARADGRSISDVPLMERGVWIGAYAPPAPWESMAAVRELERAIGRRLDLVHLFKAWGEPWGAYDGQLIRELALMTSGGRRPLITWEPWVTTQGVDQASFSLQAIAAGDHDTYVRSWAAGLRSFPGVAYLRPMHEMNGFWYPWAGGVNGNTATDYIAAWRHIHRVFREAGATNVRWVWSPYVLDVPAANVFENYYPGDGYVDVLALDLYNWGASGECAPDGGAERWQDVEELLTAPYRRIAELGPQPVWLAEVGSAEAGGDKAAWLGSLLGLLGHDRVSAVVWFHADKERDWRITSSAASAAAVAAALAGTVPAAEPAVAPLRPAAASDLS